MASSKRRNSFSTQNTDGDEAAWRDSRQKTDALWSTLDDLVTDSSDYPALTAAAFFFVGGYEYGGI